MLLELLFALFLASVSELQFRPCVDIHISSFQFGSFIKIIAGPIINSTLLGHRCHVWRIAVLDLALVLLLLVALQTVVFTLCDLFGQDVGVEASEALMIGDDIVNDVGGGQSAGMQATLVRTGKYTPSDEHHAQVKPDLIVDNFASFVHFITQHLN